MTKYFLLKSEQLRSFGTEPIGIPNRMRPSPLPEVGDTIFLWANSIGLVEETIVTRVSVGFMEVGETTVYGRPLAALWLDDADRLKATIRSKLHCDRNDRLWSLPDSEVQELDAARRR